VLAEAALRASFIEFEANATRHAILLQETQEEISARDMFMARIVERMRAIDGDKHEATERDKETFLKAVSDANRIQTMLDALLPSHTPTNMQENKTK